MDRTTDKLYRLAMGLLIFDYLLLTATMLVSPPDGAIYRYRKAYPAAFGNEVVETDSREVRTTLEPRLEYKLKENFEEMFLEI